MKNLSVTQYIEAVAHGYEPPQELAQIMIAGGTISGETFGAHTLR